MKDKEMCIRDSYYKGKFRKGWVSISNCFRGTWVVGTPGSGKTFRIIEPVSYTHLVLRERHKRLQGGEIRENRHENKKYEPQ